MKSKQKNKYTKRKLGRPRIIEFVKLEVWLPHLTYASLQRVSLTKDIPIDRLATNGLVSAIRANSWGLFDTPELIDTSAGGSEDFIDEQDKIYNWLKPMGYQGMHLDEIMSLCFDTDMTIIGVSYAINGLLDKHLITKRDDVFCVKEQPITSKMYRSIKGKRLINRRLKPVSIYRKETTP